VQPQSSGGGENYVLAKGDQKYSYDYFLQQHNDFLGGLISPEFDFGIAGNFFYLTDKDNSQSTEDGTYGAEKHRYYLNHEEAKKMLSGIPGSSAAAGLSIANFVRSLNGAAKTPLLTWISLNYTIQSKILNLQLKPIYTNYMENKNQQGVYFIETYTQSYIDPHYGKREWLFYDIIDNKYLGSLYSY
jgi:hypothetical protein